jgi:small-conductance mechanosensitive channel
VLLRGLLVKLRLRPETQPEMIALNQLLAARPELIALAIFVLAFATVRSVTKPLSLRRLLGGAVFFLGFTYFLFQARQVPYAAPVAAQDPLGGFLGDGLKTIWWFWAASLCSESLRLYASRGHTPLSRYRLSQDLSVAAIYICGLIGLTTFVLHLPLQGLFVTSGAVAVILGLALQSALGDLFYGIVLSLGKPYQLGDWIALDNGAEGAVVEMNWRATHLLTDRRDIAIVPNSVIAKARIVNSSYPSRTHGTVIRLPLAPQTSPQLAARVLADAALACRLVLTQPPPVVVVKSMSAEATIFEVTLFTSEVGLAAGAQTTVYEIIFRALRIAGMMLGAATADGAGQRAVSESAPASEAGRLVDNAPVFARANPQARTALAGALVPQDYEAGETIIEQGAAVPALIVVAAGVLSLTRRSGERADEIDRIGAGGCFGVREVTKGKLSVVSVSTMTKTTIYRLEKTAFLNFMQSHETDAESAEPANVSVVAAAQPQPEPVVAEVMDWFTRQINRL